MTQSLGSGKLTILYVDDDADDRMLLSEALQEAAPHVKIETVENGVKALDFLKKSSKPPCLVIVDLNMPGMSGREVIKQLKNDKQLAELSVVVFTTSANPEDQKECARYGVDMITKPMSFADLEHSAIRLLTYCKD